MFLTIFKTYQKEILTANKIEHSVETVQIVSQNTPLKITILDELKYFISPMQAEEWNQLESNILAEGCRQSLLVWKTSGHIIDENASDVALNILIDGHNRYEICLKHIQFVLNAE